MLYRVLLGLIPTVLFGLIVTGAIPVGSLLPTSGYDSSAAAKGSEGGNQVRSPRTAEGKVSQGLGLLSPEHVSMMEDNMKAVEDMQREAAKLEADRRAGIDRSEWEAGRRGWGRPQN